MQKPETTDSRAAAKAAILEDVRRIRERKRSLNMRPTYATLIGDGVLLRALSRCSRAEFFEALRELEQEDEVKIGTTVNDIYLWLKQA